MTNLSCIGGSRAHNLQIEGSDIDLLVMVNEGQKIKMENKDGYNILYNTPSKFLNRLEGIEEYCHIWQFLYPQNFIENNFLVEYIKENREKITRANLPHIYKSFTNYFYNCISNMESFYKVRKKSISYSFLYASALYKYANGESFDKCLRPGGQQHDFLLGIRTGEISFEECKVLKENYTQKIKSVENFYKYFDCRDTFEEFKKIIESQDYMSYEDIVLSNKLVSR